MTITTQGLLALAAGMVLVAAMLTLWVRQIAVTVRLLRVQGVALASGAGLLAIHQHDWGLAITAFLVLLVKGVVAPALLLRVVRKGDSGRETSPLMNVPASLLSGAALTVLAYVASRKILSVVPSASIKLVPLGIATILVGYLLLVTRRRAISQIVGLLLVDNGIALVTFLLTSGVPLIVELGSTLDVLLVVVVLQVLVANVASRDATIEPAEMRELHD